jgi:Fe-S-cluster containining protein
MQLYQIQEQIRARSEEIAATHGDWPCQKGCDDCCRHLAASPRVTLEEWRLIANAIHALPARDAEAVLARVRSSAGQTRPVTCPLLDSASGSCRIYEARPVACRSYGFYAERRNVLGCHRIAAVAEESSEVIWGNHEGIEERLAQLGTAAELSAWLNSGKADS